MTVIAQSLLLTSTAPEKLYRMRRSTGRMGLRQLKEWFQDPLVIRERHLQPGVQPSDPRQLPHPILHRDCRNSSSVWLQAGTQGFNGMLLAPAEFPARRAKKLHGIRSVNPMEYNAGTGCLIISV